MYIFLSSTDSIQTHPLNDATDFTITLPHPIDLRNGKWSCSLIDIDTDDKDGESGRITVFCDICECSYVNDSMLPILFVGREFAPIARPLRISARSVIVSQIRIYLKGSIVDEHSFASKTVRCTLQLKEKR